MVLSTANHEGTVHGAGIDHSKLVWRDEQDAVAHQREHIFNAASSPKKKNSDLKYNPYIPV